MKRSNFLFLLILSIFSLSVGEMPFLDVLKDALQVMFSEEMRWTPLFDERLPRLFTLLLAGSSLAVSGVVMQSLFANPLASPTTLGISLGGLLCGMFALKMGLNSVSLAVPFAMMMGVILSLVFFLLISEFISSTMHSLLLLGIAFSTFLATFQGAMSYYWRHDWSFILSMSEWLSGSTQFLSWKDLSLQSILTALGFIGVFSQNKALDLLSLGEEEAQHLGLEVKKSRFILICSVGSLIASSLITIGDLPFVGLIIPHICRSLYGSSHAKLLLATVLLGASFLTGLDTFLRLFDLPFSLNHLTGLLGSLFFFLLLLKFKLNQKYAYS